MRSIRYQIHPNVMAKWKRTVLDNVKGSFLRGHLVGAADRPAGCLVPSQPSKSRGRSHAIGSASCAPSMVGAHSCRAYTAWTIAPGARQSPMLRTLRMPAPARQWPSVTTCRCRRSSGCLTPTTTRAAHLTDLTVLSR